MNSFRIISIMFLCQIGASFVDDWCYKCQCLPFLIICEKQINVHFTTSITLSTDTLMLNEVNFTSQNAANRLIRQFPYLLTFIGINSQLDCGYLNVFYNPSVNVTLVNSCHYGSITDTTIPTDTDTHSSITTIDSTTTDLTTTSPPPPKTSLSISPDSSTQMTMITSTLSTPYMSTVASKITSPYYPLPQPVLDKNQNVSLAGLVLSAVSFVLCLILIGVIFIFFKKRNPPYPPPPLPTIRDLEMDRIFNMQGIEEDDNTPPNIRDHSVINHHYVEPHSINHTYDLPSIR